MAKTCRTCGFSALARECNRRHIWVSDTELCGDHKPRETPLLLDALGEILQDLWDSRFTDGDTSGQYPCGCDLYNTVMLTPEQGEIIQAALACYKEEVGDESA